MPELTWFAVHPPRDVDLEAVTAVVRPLASRPRWGLPPTTPVVVFEVWSIGGKVQWLLGMDRRLAGDVPDGTRAAGVVGRCHGTAEWSVLTAAHRYGGRGIR